MLENLTSHSFDVAIVGAGINGASAAQHLAAAGYRVLVAEKADFADGASSRSSRLLHCGLRHLASGDGPIDMLSHPWRLTRSLRTVREDMLARDEIVRQTPQRVKPMNFCMPIYRDDAYRPWHMDIAFAALRLVSPFGERLDYRRYRRRQLGQLPVRCYLRSPEELEGAVVFREFIFDWPERIALDALAEARRMGTVVLNYTSVEHLERIGSEWRLRLTNGDDGAEVTANVVLNLAGASVDDVARLSGVDTPKKCNGIKGVHIAVRLPEAFADCGVFAFNSLGEPLYCLPWRGYHYVGLTRRLHTGPVEGVVARDEEIDWVLSETNRCFPPLGLTRQDVLYSWAGVNPLTHDQEEPLGSREIKIHDLSADGLPGMFALTGGAIMTHRRVARRLVDRVRSVLPPSGRTRLLTFPSSDEGTSDLAICSSARDEMPGSLADLMMRRLGLGWDADQGVSQARRVAELAAPHLGWGAERTEREIKDYERLLDQVRRRPE